MYHDNPAANRFHRSITTAINDTALGNGQAIRYHVPGTYTSLLIVPGHSVSSTAMRSTLRACRAAVARAQYKFGSFEPIHPDPYSFPNEGARYTGLELLIWSKHAHEAGGLTWGQLDAVIEGLQQALYGARRDIEVRFMIYDDLTAKKEQGTGELYSLIDGVRVKAAVA